MRADFETALEATCQCGHAGALHDEHGCAAFLGAFPETSRIQAHCRCQRPRVGSSTASAQLWDSTMSGYVNLASAPAVPPKELPITPARELAARHTP